jgi:hypothetical protein
MLRAGFEPASPARKAGILDRAILPEHLRGFVWFGIMQVFLVSNKFYAFKAVFKHSSMVTSFTSALFRVGA